MFDALVLIGLAFFFVWLFSASKKPETKTPVRIHNRHGHRCYEDGLNESEQAVVNTLASNLNHNDYFLFNNLTIPSAHNGSTQIDHIVVSRFGIFIIESKNYSGWIYGHANRKKWTATYENGKKYEFQNPIFQNYGHVATLKADMQYAAKYMHSIIIFSDLCKFKTPRINNVLHLSELNDYIKKFNEPKLKQVELLVAIGHLSYMCQASHIQPHVHISNIENRIAAKVEKNR